MEQKPKKKYCQKCGGELKEISRDGKWIHWQCQKCERKFRQCNAEPSIWSRVVGFYRPIKAWNSGKQEEFKDRLEYKIKEGQINGTDDN